MDASDARGGVQEEGVKITLEIIEKNSQQAAHLRFAIMPIGWEDIVPRIVTEANLLKTESAVPAALSESKGEREAEKVIA